LASQFIERLFQDLSKSGLRFELERAPAGGVGDFGEKLAVRTVTGAPIGKGLIEFSPSDLKQAA
jgi:hypothetical protein